MASSSNPLGSQYPDSWKTFQESIPGAEIGPMPDWYCPPSIRLSNYKEAPGREQFEDPILWETPGTDREDSTNLPPLFSESDTLLSPILYFSLFFDDEILSFLSKMTNAYAEVKRAEDTENLGVPLPNERPWYPTCAEEIKVWIGINLYLGYLGRSDIEGLWSTTNGVWQIFDHMSLVRFEQIRRYFHIYGPDDLSQLPSELQPPWYHKFDKFASKLRTRFHQYFKPGTRCSIDESMAMCTGRTYHKTHIDRKPITDGYKIITLAFAGYVWDFIWWSGNGSEDAGPSEWNDFYRRYHGITSRSSLAVLTLCHTLPFDELVFVIFMDNFYASIKLFALLRTVLNIGACGTIRQGNGNNIPKQLLALEDPESQRHYQKTIVLPTGQRRRNPIPPPPLTEREKMQREWNWLEEVVLEGSVYCFAWRDNGIVYGMVSFENIS